MIGKIIGAIAGEKLAKRASGGVDGPGGALLGFGAVALLKRLGPIGLIAAVGGGYALKHYFDRREAVPADAQGV